MRQVLASALHSLRREAAGLPRQARRRVTDDLRRDPYLVYILLAALALAVFWVWHRLPNFATRDERWRVVDPVETFAAVYDDPSIGSFQEGLTTWRSYGAAMYLSALALFPVAIAAAIHGELDAFAAMGSHTGVGYWEHWQRTPAWIWSASILLARLANVAFAVGSVYVVYRIGVEVRDRPTGRLAATFTAVTWALIVLTHEAGEDVPSLFFFLAAVYFAVRYLDAGERRLFYLGCLCGGASIAFKLSGGVSALVLGGAYVLRAHRSDESLRAALVRPRLLGGGLLVALVTIAVGYPSIVFGAPTEFTGRVSRAFSAKSQIHGWRDEPSWWWIARGTLHGVGLPLALGFVGGVAAALARIRWRPSRTSDALAVLLIGAGTFLAVFSTWEYVRTHHLLPTFPLLAVVLSVALVDLREHHRTAGRVLAAVLVVTTAVYAGVGTLGYASEPKDQATEWLATHADADDRLETYVRDPQESAAPHWMAVDYVPTFAMDRLHSRCPAFVELNSHLALAYLAPESWSLWAERHSGPDRAAFLRRLLSGEDGAYEVAARFGPPPRYLDDGERPPVWRELLRAGVNPRSVQYGDPQDIGTDQYTVILRRTAGCAPVGLGGVQGG
jgi:hypothetical protein